MFRSSRVLVFSDFNCPFCFTLNEWLEELNLAGHVRWVGIEHRPDLPVTGTNMPADRELMLSEVAEVNRRAPELAVVPPNIWSNSRVALMLQNAVEDDFPEQAPTLRRKLFRSYWKEGKNFASRSFLNETLQRLDLPGLASIFLDEMQTNEQNTWWREQLDRLPAMLGPTGARHLGLQDKATVEAFVYGAVFEPVPGDGCK